MKEIEISYFNQVVFGGRCEMKHYNFVRLAVEHGKCFNGYLIEDHVGFEYGTTDWDKNDFKKNFQLGKYGKEFLLITEPSFDKGNAIEFDLESFDRIDNFYKTTYNEGFMSCSEQYVLFCKDIKKLVVLNEIGILYVEEGHPMIADTELKLYSYINKDKFVQHIKPKTWSSDRIWPE